jgi:DNA-binding response OmpR family regulator
MIVDDDRELCAWLEAGLSAHSFVTESHTDPATALAALRDSELDVVVTI